MRGWIASERVVNLGRGNNVAGLGTLFELAACTIKIKTGQMNVPLLRHGAKSVCYVDDLRLS